MITARYHGKEGEGETQEKTESEEKRGSDL